MKHLALYDVPPLYDLMVQPGPCERFYRDLANRVGGPILELASGSGRLTIPLALDGHEVVGLDASKSMRSFALAIISCNSLAHLTTNEELKS